jgi:hypothetical protein
MYPLTALFRSFFASQPAARDLETGLPQDKALGRTALAFVDIAKHHKSSDGRAKVSSR